MNYPGGKGGCFRHIINEMPPHRVYIEAFLGGGNVMVNKKPADLTIGVDADAGVVQRFASSHRPGWRGDIELLCGDALCFLARRLYEDDELVYCDPPYLHSTRKDKSLYLFELSDQRHYELLLLLVRLPCLVMISGYASDLYEDVLERRHGWRCVRFPSMTRHGLATESLWCNFPAVHHRHDARYIGADYRERERIKRKRDRWRARFTAMDAGERQVVMEALLATSAPSEAAMGTAPSEAAMGTAPPGMMLPARDPIAAVIDAAGDTGDRDGMRSRIVGPGAAAADMPVKENPFELNPAP